jgi:hypothetical protein
MTISTYSLLLLFLFLISFLLSPITCSLNLQILNRPNAVCNDGSPATYYIRPSATRVWVIYLMGGGYCFDANTCAQRWAESPFMMTSKGNPTTLPGAGILSENAVINPLFSTGNLVFVPYCSSDVWTGTHEWSGKLGDWHFQGNRIIDGVIDDLLAKFNLKSAQLVVLTGTSAGGIGTLMNLDRFAQRLNWCKVFGIPDAGFFLPIPPYIDGDCKTVNWCIFQRVTQMGLATWEGVTPPSCKYAGAQRYLCYFGPNLFPFKTPILTIQFVYDAAQMALLGVYPPFNQNAVAYIDATGRQVRDALKGTKAAAYGATCLNHGILVNNKWNLLTVNGVDLSVYIYNWLLSGGTSAQQQIDECQGMNCNPTCNLIVEDSERKNEQDFWSHQIFGN